MPSGSTHLKFEIATLPIWTFGGAILGVPWEELVIFTLSYVAASLFLSPDLDLERSDTARRWGALRILWIPYSKVFKHRGLSHSILFGPLTRVLYLAALGAAAWGILYLLFGIRGGWRMPKLSYAGAALAGVYLSNFLHVALDHVVSYWKRRVP